MATNYRTVLNNVLIALGEPEIASGTAEITSQYHKLLGLFFNHRKEEIEDQHNWRALRSTEPLTLTASTSSVAITNANERSRVLRVYDELSGEERALVFDVTDASNPFRLREMDLSELLRRRAMDVNSTNTQPSWFAVDNTGEDAMSLQVYPTPTVQRNIDVTMIIPQAPLANDNLDINIKIPTRGIEIGTIMYALEERGEELGVNSVFTERLFDRIVGNAVARDAAEQGEYQLVPV